MMSGSRLIQKHKPQLLEALMGDPDPLLQHCHARGILTNKEYNDIRDGNTRSRQVRDILDHVIHKDNRHALSFLELLRTRDLQDAFPKLHFLLQLQINKRKMPKHTEKAAKRRQEMLEQQNTINSRPVSEREMMKTAGCIGNSWRELGIMALEMNTTTLQQIEEDNKLHRERVFAMLRKWSLRERERATPARLYTLLTQEDTGVDPRLLSFLLESN